MCRVPRVSPGGYYDWRGRPKREGARRRDDLVVAQTLRGGETITSQSSAKHLPSRFRVTAQQGASNRMPSYRLEPEDAPTARQTPLRRLEGPTTSPGTRAEAAPVPPASPQKAPAWPESFLAEAQALARDLASDRPGRHGLQFVVEELQEVVNDRPDDLLTILLAGYVASVKLACASEPDRAYRGHFDDLARKALDPTLQNVATTARPGGLGSLLGAVTR